MRTNHRPGGVHWLGVKRAHVRVASLLVLVCVVGLSSALQAKVRKLNGQALLLQRTVSPAQVKARLSMYRTVKLGVQAKQIPAAVRGMLPHVRMAADAIDRVYWSQMSQQGPAMRDALAALAKSGKNPAAIDFLKLLNIHYGPWDRHAEDAPFLGRYARAPGAAFYPRDVSKRELDAWIRKHPAAASSLYNPYTVVRRAGRKLKTVPYSKAYATDLKIAANSLRKAAAAYTCAKGKCRCRGLIDFFKSRARSFADDSYLTSEILWLETGDCPLDVAIGPYEYYEWDKYSSPYHPYWW